MQATSPNSGAMVSPGRRVTGHVSPARSQYERYISLMTDQISPPNRLRGHLRSSSTNPLDRTEQTFSAGERKGHQVNPGLVYETGSITSLSSLHPSNLVAVGTKTKSLSLLIDRSNDFNRRRTLEYNRNNNNNNSATFNNSYNNNQKTQYNKDYEELRNYNNNPQQQKRQPRGFYSFINNNNSNKHQWERASADRDLSYGYPGTQAAGVGAARSLDREGLLRNHADADPFSSSMCEEDMYARGGADDDDDAGTPSPGYFNAEACISKDGYVLELQSQVANLNKECALLQQDLDLAKDKLTSTMNSIKSFWSPELKKERGLRKEDNGKYVSLCERLKSLEIENRQHVKALMRLEQDNRVLREQQSSSSGSPHSNNNTPAKNSNTPNSNNSNNINNVVSTGTGLCDYTCNTQQQQQHKQPFNSSDVMKRERDRHCKEVTLLKKTLQEMELRIESQQKTMATRDDTIKMLSDFLQQHQRQRCQEVKRSLEGGRSERGRDGEGVDGGDGGMLDMHEKETRALQEKLKQLEEDKGTREAEMRLLHAQLEGVQRQKEEREVSVATLQQQLTSLQLQLKTLQKETEAYRGRLRDKEENVEAKMRQITCLQSERLKMTSELAGLHEQVHSSHCALVSANKKARWEGRGGSLIERLEDELKEKDAVISSSTRQLSSIQADCSSHDDVVDGLREIIADKGKQIEKLKEQKERQQREMEEEMREVTERSNEVKAKLKQLQDDLLNKQELELELKNELGRLRSELATKDKLLSRQEAQMSEVDDSLQQTKQMLAKTQESSKRQENDTKSRLQDTTMRLEEREREVRQGREAVEKLSAKVEKLEELLGEKVRVVSALQAELVVIRKGGGGGGGGDGSEGGEGGAASNEDDDSIKSALMEKDARITELEGALRESIKITAQREVVMAEHQMRLEHTERMMESQQEESEGLRRSLDQCRHKLSSSEQALKEKEELLKEQFNDSKKQLSEVYEMKQEAILAAISEKDAHIALLEMAPNQKIENIQEVEKLSNEKIKLQAVLKELTQSRMKLLQHRGHMRSSSASSLLHYATHRDQLLAKVDFGTYYVYHNEMLNDDDMI